MTGFASLTRDDETATITVTIRSVNHRFLDMQLRLPPSLPALEPRMRALVQQRVARGRVEVMVAVQQRRSPPIEVELNETFLQAIEAALQRAREQGYVQGTLTPGDLLRFPQALAIRDKAEDPAVAEEQLASLGLRIEGAVEAALEELDSMRVREGGFLRGELDSRRQQLQDLFDRIATAADDALEGLRVRLAERVRELRADGLADESLIAQEIARFAGRSDITEEVVRFRGHLDHWQALT
ncbi:MAG: YicC family protein, partial [Vicinamibacterales bacterium]